VSERIDSILELTGNPAGATGNFGAVCAGCHGSDGLGTSLAPSLAERVPSRTDEGLLQSILQGRGDMPAWQENFQDQEFADLLAYLRANF
jgi:mono/diheme cytochrome c family protein